MTLTPFSKSYYGLDCWKMAFLHLVSWKNGWILTNHVHLYVHLYFCDKEKNWLGFGDFDSIFKVTGGSRMNGWILTKFAHLYCCDMEKNWLDFGDLESIFKVTHGLRLLKMACLHPISWRNGWILTNDQEVRSVVAQWWAHWLLELKVSGSIPGLGKGVFRVRTRFHSCHLQAWPENSAPTFGSGRSMEAPLCRKSHTLWRLKNPTVIRNGTYLHLATRSVQCTSA